MVARTKAALRSWRAASVQLVVAVEEGREAAAGFCRGEEKGGCCGFLPWRREGRPAFLWGRAAGWWWHGCSLAAQEEKRERRRRGRKESDGSA